MSENSTRPQHVYANWSGPVPEGATIMGFCGRVYVLNAKTEDPTPRTSAAELEEIDVAITRGDNLPNTVASLETKVKRRALLVAVQYPYDGRSTNGSLRMLTSPGDVLKVYHMLLTRGYEPQNIRILVMRATDSDDRSYPSKNNIMDSLEWLFQSAEPGDHRYLHFGGHGYAYEVREGQGRVARARPVPPTSGHHERPDSATYDEQLNSSPSGGHVKFYREALLTEWRTPIWSERREETIKGIFSLHTWNRIDNEEFNAMVAKLPKGCVLTITLDCFHGAKIRDADNQPAGWLRGEAGSPTEDPEDGQSATGSIDPYPNTAPHNLFVPPAFHIYSDCSFDPKVTMERVQGSDPLNGVQATVAFTAAVRDLKGDVSCHEMLQEISRRVDEANEGEDGHPLIQLSTSCGGEFGTAGVKGEAFVV